MGTTYTTLDISDLFRLIRISINFVFNLTASDLITVLGIIVNAFLAIWIVRQIQNRLNNKRILKDHFIQEIKDIRNEYRAFLNNLYSNKVLPSEVIPWFKLMNIRINDIMLIINAKHNIQIDIFNPYKIDLKNQITDNTAFINNFISNNPIILASTSKNRFYKFEQRNSHIFNDVIILINDAK